jgi:hypothetical protein
MGEVECKEANLARNRGARRLPSEPPGNHQVEDQKRIAFHLEHDSLAHTAQRHDPSTANRIERWVDGTEQKGGHQPHVLNRVADDARVKRVQIELDVREFGHALDSLAACESGDVQSDEAPDHKTSRAAGYAARLRALG